MDETSNKFAKFNATDRSLLITFRPPGEQHDPTVFKECITALTSYLVDMSGSDLVGLTIPDTSDAVTSET